MAKELFSVPVPTNEPILDYGPGSAERGKLKTELENQYNQQIEIPLIIGGKDVKTGNLAQSVCPHEHGHVLATYHKASSAEIDMAIKAAIEAEQDWEAMPWYDRAAIFLKAADLISTKYRFKVNATSMLDQSKNAFQAEIDAVCELADFFRFNAFYMQEIYKEQPMYHASGSWNRLENRSLEGFVFAVTPFNFASIAGNLPASPAMMGNVALWKPASSTVYVAYILMRIFEEAGLPPGVINFVPGPGSQVGNPVMASKHLAGVHFTGSTSTFQGMWQTIGANIKNYRSYPRIVGETGGKNFIMVHESADVEEVAVATIRGAFEYQGQKCSAASRMYVSHSMWPELKSRIGDMLSQVKMGDVRDFGNFVNSMIDEPSFDNTMDYIRKAELSADADILYGGKGDKSKGYFVEPTVILAKDPHFVTMEEEIFAPVLTIYAYDDNKYEETLRLCDETSPYALTGAIFARDRNAVALAFNRLRHAAGNFYINDKPTGAVVGQQPFGGARGSGTNDKAGSYLNLIRWVSPRTIKENFVPPVDFSYPFMR